MIIRSNSSSSSSSYAQVQQQVQVQQQAPAPGGSSLRSTLHLNHGGVPQCAPAKGPSKYVSGSSSCYQAQEQCQEQQQCQAAAPTRTLAQRLATALERVEEAKAARDQVRGTFFDNLAEIADSRLFKLAQEAVVTKVDPFSVRLWADMWLDGALGIMYQTKSAQLASLRYGIIPHSEAYKYNPVFEDGRRYDSSSESYAQQQQAQHRPSNPERSVPPTAAPPPYVPAPLSLEEQRTTFCRHWVKRDIDERDLNYALRDIVETLEAAALL